MAAWSRTEPASAGTPRVQGQDKRNARHNQANYATCPNSEVCIIARFYHNIWETVATCYGAPYVTLKQTCPSDNVAACTAERNTIRGGFLPIKCLTGETLATRQVGEEEGWYMGWGINVQSSLLTPRRLTMARANHIQQPVWTYLAFMFPVHKVYISLAWVQLFPSTIVRRPLYVTSDPWRPVDGPTPRTGPDTNTQAYVMRLWRGLEWLKKKTFVSLQPLDDPIGNRCGVWQRTSAKYERHKRVWRYCVSLLRRTGGWGSKNVHLGHLVLDLTRNQTRFVKRKRLEQPFKTTESQHQIKLTSSVHAGNYCIFSLIRTISLSGDKVAKNHPALLTLHNGLLHKQATVSDRIPR